MAEQQYGPRVTVTRSCADCKACETESYRCQGDSGVDWYCAHPVYEKRRYIGISSTTPEWCPAPRGVGVSDPVQAALEACRPILARLKHQQDDDEAARALELVNAALGVSGAPDQTFRASDADGAKR